MCNITDPDINVYASNLYQGYIIAVFRESIKHSIEPVQTH